MATKIRVKISSFEQQRIASSARHIFQSVLTTGSIVKGPIPLPTRKKRYTVLRSPHVDKKSREQFQMCDYKRVIDIYTPEAPTETIEVLSNLEIKPGVKVVIEAHG